MLFVLVCSGTDVKLNVSSTVYVCVGSGDE